MSAIAAITIRPLSAADAAPYAALRQQSLREEPLAFASSPEEDFSHDLAGVEARLSRAPDAVAFGAFDGGLLIGFVTVLRQDRMKTRHKAQVAGMYVQPAFTGRGVGGRLIDVAIDHARELGVDAVGLAVADTARAARRVYERAGFTRWGTEPGAIRHGAARVDVHYLELSL